MFLKKLHLVCEQSIDVISRVFCFVMMIVTTLDTIGRYLFNAPIIWSYDISTFYLFIPLVFFASTSTYRAGDFIKVTLILELLPKKTVFLLNYLSNFLSVLFCAVLTVATYNNFISVMKSNKMLGAIDFPMWPSNLAVTVGLFFLTLRIAFDIFPKKNNSSRG